MTLLLANGFTEEVSILIRKMFIAINEKYDSSDYSKINNKNKFDFMRETLEALRTCSDVQVAYANTSVLDIQKHRGVSLSGSQSIIINGTKSTEVQISTLLHELQHCKQKGFNVLYEYIAGDLLKRAIREGNAITTEFLKDEKQSRESEIRLGEDGTRSIILPSYSENGLNYTIYVKLQFLLGEHFMNEWQNDASYSVDYIEKAKEILIQRYGAEKGKKYGDELFGAIAIALINYEFLVNSNGTQQMMGNYIRYALQTRDLSYCSSDVKKYLEQKISTLMMQMKSAKQNGLNPNTIWEELETNRRILEDVRRARNNSSTRITHLDEGLQVARAAQTIDIAQSIVTLERLFEEMLKDDIERSSSITELAKIQKFLDFYQKIQPKLLDVTTQKIKDYIDYNKMKAIIDCKNEGLLVANNSHSNE